MHNIFQKTLTHPLSKRNLVEFLPIDFVLSLALPKTGLEKTDIGNWNNNHEVSMSELWSDLLQNGMRDPLIIGVGRVDRTSRLEAGNHRIWLFKQKSIELVPCVCLVGDTSITHISNGNHRYYKDLLIPKGWEHFGPYPEKIYMKPSQVFTRIDI